MRKLRLYLLIAMAVAAASFPTANALAAPTAAARPAVASAAPAWHIVRWFSRETWLSSVAAVSRTEAWAVGAVGKGAGRPAIFRWNGHTWRHAAVPGLSPRLTLRSVQATGANNVWIVGQMPDGTSAVVLRYVDSSWFSIPTPTGPLDASAIDVLGPANAWWAQPDGTGSTTLWHWDGASWTANTVPGNVTGMDGRGQQFWLATQAASSSPAQTTVLRWTGSGWQNMRFPDARKLYWPQVAVSGAGQAWVQDAPVHGQWSVYHWTGKLWQRIMVPAHADGRPVVVTNVMSYDGHHGVWFEGTTHWDGRHWIVPALGPHPLTVFDMQAAVAPIPGTARTWGIGYIDTSNTAKPRYRYFLAVVGRRT